MWFSKQNTEQSEGQFGYLGPKDIYMDTACQTLRPQTVIDAEQEYYQTANACGGRSAYPWAQKVDARVERVRSRFLKILGLSEREYLTFFGLNTTWSINLILNSLDWTEYDQIITTDIEHNSVFLPVMQLAKQHQKERIILSREDSGAVIYDPSTFRKPVVILNTTSNIDGRELENREQLITDVHQAGGIVLLDACQTFGHGFQDLAGTQADAIFGSGHKMYGPSLGIGVIRKSLVENMTPAVIGGGTVAGVTKDSFNLITGENLSHRLEAGLQSWAAIWAMDASLDVIEQADWSHEQQLGIKLHTGLQNLGATILSGENSPVQTFYFENLESSLVGKLLGQQGVMVRTGYFCCHYYLTSVQKLPHLVRMSLGLHSTEADVEKALEVLTQIKKLR